MPSPDVICVVQARMGSTRLPGKVVADLAGRPLLRFLLERLRQFEPATIVVATSELDRDDAVARVADDAGVAVVRGSEQDVLSRFGVAIERFPADHVVRITGDCPLIDPTIVGQLVDHHLSRGADYTCNVLPRTFPKGLDVEVVTATALRLAIEQATDPAEREHVTPFFYRHPERFQLANLRSGDDLGDERWTVDTPDDLDRVRGIVGRLGVDGRFGWRDALAVVGRQVTPAPGMTHLRPAEPGDRDRLLEWRSDPDSIRFSLTGTAVSRADHEVWFAARLEDPATRLSIAEVDGHPVGMTRVDVVEAVGTVSIALDPAARGRGLGRILLLALIEQWRGDLQAVRLEASAHQANEASRRAFRSAGFTSVGMSDGFERFAWDNARA